MKNQKFSSEYEEENAYELDYFIHKLKSDGLDSIKLYGCKRDIGGEMWCKKFNQFVETEDDCGECNCQEYEPCNGKNGRCRYLINGYTENGKEYLLTKKGLKEIK